MALLVRTWNVYHGRTYPKSGRTYLERMVRLATLDAPDVVALQEVPLWALARLERWSGMHAIWAVTVPSMLGPVARWVTDLDPVRVRFTIAGQANAVLVNPHWDVAEHEVYVMNPDVGRIESTLGRPQRRVCQALELAVGGDTFVLGNLHATNSPETARREVEMTVDLLAHVPRLVLCGDFNVRRMTVPGFTSPIPGIDQILVRGLEFERRPHAWPLDRRRVDGRLLSDHAPVEAVISWS